MTTDRPAAEYLERTIETPVGDARARVYPPGSPTAGAGAGCLVLGHGAGGRSWSADLLALTRLSEGGWTVVLVEQPWRVAGRSVAPRPALLDTAWVAVLAALTQRVAPGPAVAAHSPGTPSVGPLSGRSPLPGPLICGGRSAGARVACRTASQIGAAGVLALAFPLHPPGRPERSRVEELVAAGSAGVPVLVVNGRRDTFGTPDEIQSAVACAGAGARGTVQVAAVQGGHGFTADPADVVDRVRAWLAER